MVNETDGPQWCLWHSILHNFKVFLQSLFVISPKIMERTKLKDYTKVFWLFLSTTGFPNKQLRLPLLSLLFQGCGELVNVFIK